MESEKYQLDQQLIDHYEQYLTGIMVRGGVGREEAMEILHTLYTQYWEDDIRDHGGNRVVFDQYIRVRGGMG